MQASSPERERRRWLPLGSARVVDWNYLERPKAEEGQHAWVADLRGETVLLRAGSIRHGSIAFEFNGLAREDLVGTIAVTPSRPERAHLRLETVVKIERKLGYVETLTLQAHPRTGLFGLVDRRFTLTEGWLAQDSLPVLPAEDAVALAKASSEAVVSHWGRWLHALLEVVAHAADKEASPPGGTMRPVDPPECEEHRPLVADEDPKTGARTTEDAGFETSAETASETRPGEDPGSSTEGESAPPRSPDVRGILLSTKSGETWNIENGETYIGRSKQCSIILRSQRVSRRHASVTMEADGFYLNDLGAANGIWAGSVKIDRERIEHGAEYIIGDVLVTFTYPG